LAEQVRVLDVRREEVGALDDRQLRRQPVNARVRAVLRSDQQIVIAQRRQLSQQLLKVARTKLRRSTAGRLVQFQLLIVHTNSLHRIRDFNSVIVPL